MQKCINISVQSDVQKALNWSELKYTTFQYEKGIECLNVYIPNDTDSIALLESSRFFWVWWMKRWSDRDTEFLNAIKHISRMKWESIYEDVHDPKLLSNRIYPNRIIWQQALKVKV